MTTARNADGTIDVRVVLTVQVDPRAWAEYMMDEHPDEVRDREVRADVKRRIQNKIADWPMSESDYSEDVNVPIGDVRAEGIYPSPYSRRS